jgi:hypothetical protein
MIASSTTVACVTRRSDFLAGLGLVVAALTVAACDQGHAFVAENRTDQELVARVTGKELRPTESGSAVEWRQDVTLLPADSRQVILVQPFTTNFNVWTVEILRADCSVIAMLGHDGETSWERDGTLVVIEPDMSVRHVDEFPRDETAAATTDRCHGLPDELTEDSASPKP